MESLKKASDNLQWLKEIAKYPKLYPEGNLKRLVETAFEKNRPDILKLLVDNTSDQRDHTIVLPYNIPDNHLECVSILLKSNLKITNFSINRIISKAFDNLEWLKEITKHTKLYSNQSFKNLLEQFKEANGKDEFLDFYIDSMSECENFPQNGDTVLITGDSSQQI